MEKLLNELVEKLRQAHGKRLISVILYGSGASGEVHDKFSDLNILCVLAQVTPAELADSEPVFRWWREKGNPAPLLLSTDEVAGSTDCFPIEFHDILDRRRVIHGDDVVAALRVDDVFYRAQVEHELRAKLLRLRQKAAGVLSDKQLLLRLLADSVSTFVVLGRHAVRLRGREPGWGKRGIVKAMQEEFGISGQAFDMLLDLREGKVRPRDADPARLFQTCLEEIAVVTAAVDQMDR